MKAVQHAHSFFTHHELMKKDLTKKTQEATKLLQQLNQAEDLVKNHMDKTNVENRPAKRAKATTKESRQRLAKPFNSWLRPWLRKIRRSKRPTRRLMSKVKPTSRISTASK